MPENYVNLDMRINKVLLELMFVIMLLVINFSFYK